MKQADALRLLVMSEIDTIKELDRSRKGACWEIGRRLSALRETGAWKEVADTWPEFTRKCIGGMSAPYSLQLMQIAEEFDVADVEKYGTSKLAIVLRAEPDRRSRAMWLLRQGASKRDLLEFVMGRPPKQRAIG